MRQEPLPASHSIVHTNPALEQKGSGCSANNLSDGPGMQLRNRPKMPGDDDDEDDEDDDEDEPESAPVTATPETTGDEGSLTDAEMKAELDQAEADEDRIDKS
jgi:hypothetical protein